MDKTATEPAAKKRLEFDQPLSCRPKRQKVVIISKTKRAGLIFSVPKITIKMITKNLKHNLQTNNRTEKEIMLLCKIK